jgi:hypothetical protein
MRNRIIASTDWTQLSDSPLSTDMKNAWAGYRQELRDLDFIDPDMSNINQVNWPEPPQ